MILDRFAFGIADPQEMYPAAKCAACDDELFPGDSVLEHDGELLCSSDCVVDYLVGVGALADVSLDEKNAPFCWGRK